MYSTSGSEVTTVRITYLAAFQPAYSHPVYSHPGYSPPIYRRDSCRKTVVFENNFEAFQAQLKAIREEHTTYESIKYFVDQTIDYEGIYIFDRSQFENFCKLLMLDDRYFDGCFADKIIEKANARGLLFGPEGWLKTLEDLFQLLEWRKLTITFRLFAAFISAYKEKSASFFGPEGWFKTPEDFIQLLKYAPHHNVCKSLVAVLIAADKEGLAQLFGQAGWFKTLEEFKTFLSDIQALPYDLDFSIISASLLNSLYDANEKTKWLTFENLKTWMKTPWDFRLFQALSSKEQVEVARFYYNHPNDLGDLFQGTFELLGKIHIEGLYRVLSDNPLAQHFFTKALFKCKKHKEASFSLYPCRPESKMSSIECVGCPCGCLYADDFKKKLRFFADPEKTKQENEGEIKRRLSFTLSETVREGDVLQAVGFFNEQKTFAGSCLRKRLDKTATTPKASSTNHLIPFHLIPSYICGRKR